MTEQALNYLLERSEKSRNLAGASLARARISEQQLQQQIAMLQQYRDEYRQRMQRTMTEGAQLHVVRDFQQFLGSLDKAIAEAELYLAKQKQLVKASYDEMALHQMQMSTYTTLVERRNEAAMRMQEKREHREHDALAAAVYQRKLAADSTQMSTSE